MRPAWLLLLLSPAAGCSPLALWTSGQTTAPMVADSTEPVVPSDVEVGLLSYPAPVARDFAVCPPGLVLVPAQGGVAVAGWDSWLVAPDHDIHSVACGEEGDVFYVARGWLLQQLPDRDEVPLATVPNEHFHVVAAGDGAWVWGTDGATSRVMHWDPLASVVQVGGTPSRIEAAAAAGLDALVTAVAVPEGGRLVLWSLHAEPQVLATLDEVPRGLAVEPDGSVLAALASGIVRIHADGRLALVAAGAFGALVLRGDTLFALVANEAHVVQIAR